MFILCNCNLAAPPPPTLWLRGGSALLLCRRWNTYFLWVISSIHSQPALCAWVTNLYEINQFPWKRIFLINPSLRLKASYLRPKKEKKLQTFPLRAISGKKKKPSSNNSFGTKGNVMITRENNLFIQLWFLFLSNLFLFLYNLFWSGFKMFMMKFLCKWKC